ncbi:MAG: YerC/YecD family TrpR-related protein [bacterium]|nr:YerC/YecD family TrpR-related protein [bacterium]
MTQVSKYPIPKEIVDRIFEIFLKTFVEIKNKEEADQFISDLLTPTERIMLAKRLSIAFLLEKNYDYRTIQRILKVSSPTIASVNSSRVYGSQGYKKLIKKILRGEKMVNLFETSIIKLLSAPSTLERGKGTWSYLKQQAEKQKKKNKKGF